MSTPTEPTTVVDETTAMRRIAAALDKLDPATQARVVRWAYERYTTIPVYAEVVETT